MLKKRLAGLACPIGNGCSVTQFVPILSEGTNAVKKITQFSRQAHWLSERPNSEYSPWFKWALRWRWVPSVMRLYSAQLYWNQEKLFSGFSTIAEAKIREQWLKIATDCIQKVAPAKYYYYLYFLSRVAAHAPAKYRNALIPK